ncbi:MAG: molybdenum cofactor guanylyltransferase MobA [Pseudomonadota bacterium]
MIRRTEMLGTIIAGGLATRMGGTNKPLAILKGRPLLAHAYDRLLPQVSDVVVNANRDLDQITFALPGGVELVRDAQEFSARGPLAGLHACLRYARSKRFAYVATVAADTPFFPQSLFTQLAAPSGDSVVRIARHNGYRHPLFALWPTNTLADLEAFFLEDKTNKVMAFAQRHALVEVDIEASGNPFFNINTQEELLEAGATFGEKGQ